jgi:hypothetical protein
MKGASELFCSPFIRQLVSQHLARPLCRGVYCNNPRSRVELLIVGNSSGNSRSFSLSLHHQSLTRDECLSTLLCFTPHAAVMWLLTLISRLYIHASAASALCMNNYEHSFSSCSCRCCLLMTIRCASYIKCNFIHSSQTLLIKHFPLSFARVCVCADDCDDGEIAKSCEIKLI